MKHWLYHYETVHGEPERLERVLRHELRDLIAATAADDHDVEATAEGDLLVALPAHVLGLDVHKTVRLHTGVAERRDIRTVIPVRWHADPGRPAFPSFEGTIELEPQSTSTAHLTIVGAARVPMGAVGAAADATVLGSVAESTVRYLVQRVAAGLADAATRPEAEPAQPTADRLQVRDVMTVEPLVLHDDMPLKTGALLLFHYDVAGAPVRTDAGGLVGVLSETDLVNSVAPRRPEDASAPGRPRTVGDACSRPAHEVTPTASLRRAAELMRDHDVARLVVVDHSEIVGVVSRHDLLAALLRTDADVRAALDRVLADHGWDDVVGSVEWGVASLRGRVATRTAAADLMRDVEALDGVVTVDAGLTWETDDTIKPAPMM